MKIVTTGGIGLWLILNVINHLTDPAGTRFAIAQFMRMESLAEIDTPIRRRAVHQDAIHGMAFASIVVMQAIVGLILLTALAAFVVANPNAVGLASIGFAAFSALWLLFLLAGAWFGYWIKLGDLQRTHLILLGIGMLGAIVAAT